MTHPTPDERYAANVVEILKAQAKKAKRTARKCWREAQAAERNLAHLRTTPRCLRENAR